MKPGDLFNAKVGTVSVTIEEIRAGPPSMRWMITHQQRIKGNSGRGVAFYGATRAEAIEKLVNSKRRLPKDAHIQFQT